jgi:predicted membrane protein
MFKRGLLAIIGSKILFWLKPELKIVVRNIVICAVFILITIYIQSEYIKWSNISGDKEFVTLSFILKNGLILLSLMTLLFSVKRPNFKYDRFDKFRNKKLKSETDKKLEPQPDVKNSEIDDAYFDKFRTKKKLRTTQEIKLSKK